MSLSSPMVSSVKTSPSSRALTARMVSRIHTRPDGLLAHFLQPALFHHLLHGIGVLSCPSDVEYLVVVQGLTGHSLLCELGADLVQVGNEGGAPVLQNPDCVAPSQNITRHVRMTKSTHCT
jgi:hypothetical protein